MERQPLLKDVQVEMNYEGYLLVRKASRNTGKTGKEYLSMTLCDISMEVNAIMWDNFKNVPEVGEIVHITGSRMTDFNGKLQLKITKMKHVTEEDDFDMNRIVPTAPDSPENMFGIIRARLEQIRDDEIRTLVLARLSECGEPLMFFPAARSLHHAERSGLLHHTVTMLLMADKVCEVYPRLDADLLAAGVVLHDLCKLTEMNADAYGVVSAYTKEGELIGHLVQGVARLAILGEKLGIGGEKLLLLQHMILSHHDLPEYGSPKPPMFPEAEVLHMLDLLDARMFEMNRELDAVQPGEFSERIWSLDRKLYRRQGGE